jgi:ubiquinone/menaquinone biosynthesis C-methylase UbiE
MMRNLIGTQNESARDAWVRKVLNNLVRGSRILDAGAGEQKYREDCEHLEYVAQDFAQYDPLASRTALQAKKWDYGKLDIVSDITNIPVPDESFEAILCTEVLEHIKNPVLAIKEFARILKPGGHLILTAPFCSLTHFAPHFYSTGFSRYFYEEVCPTYNLEILQIDPNGSYFEYIGQELRRLPSVAERYTKTHMNVINRIVLRVMLSSLSRLSKLDSGSSEVLCFGFHLLASKANPAKKQATDNDAAT